MKTWSKAMIGASWAALAVTAVADPVPYASLGSTPAPFSASVASQTPVYGSESSKLHDGVEAAKSGDLSRALAIKAALQSPLAQRIVQWAILDNAGTLLSYADLDQTNRDLDGWPRASRRWAALEKAMEAAGATPTETVAFFAGSDPITPQGAMALASAYQASGASDQAQALIKRFWRERVFEADQQVRMRERFGAYLTADDDAQRLELLLYGAQGPAARAMLDRATPDVRLLGEARMALKADRNDASAYVARVPPALQSDPGLAFDRARYYRKRNLDVLAIGLLASFPKAVPANADIMTAVWAERRALMNAALRSGDVQGAYTAASVHGLASGPEYAEAEFFAGWIALDRLHDPLLADQHFARLQAAVTTPISVSRAYFWRGRAAEQRRDAATSDHYYTLGAQYYTTFYGQLAAEKIGHRQLTLVADPMATAAEKQAFDALDLVQASKLLEAAGEHDAFRTFVLAQADQLASAQAFAQLIDVARFYGDQDLGMRVARVAAQKGYYLTEHGYPIVQTPVQEGAAEPAYILAIARQESNFDPNARSGPGARGLMQLMPATASIMARKLGVAFSTGRLQDGDYNLKLGGRYLGDLVSEFGGSYVLASASYNAGPGRPVQWISYCGDPRGGASDPLDFIECIPFSETRNYVMRTLETTQIYRARLNAGTAPLTLAEDLKRGAWTPPPPATPSGGLPETTPPSSPVPYSNLSQSTSSR